MSTTSCEAFRRAARDSSPLETRNELRVPLYTAEFAADPQAAYARMRGRFGSLVPVWLAPGVPATLVIGYWTALRILNDPEHFPADPTLLQRGVPAECPVLPMMQKRPNALRSTGIEHTRYRAAIVDALGRVDLIALHAVVERSAVGLINGFSAQGRADLLGDYAFPLVSEVISALIGCDPDISEQAATWIPAIVATRSEVVLVAAKKYTAEQQEEFFRVLDRGTTIRAAAAAAGVSPDAGYQWVRRAGGATPRPRPRVYSEREKAEFFRRLAENPNVSAVARELGFTRITCYKWAHQAGIFTGKSADAQRQEFLRLRGEGQNSSTGCWRGRGR